MIRTRGLLKRYGRVRALDGLDLEVPTGAIYGFIGENGAGKTTAIRVLATLILPDRGEAEVAGADVLRQPAEVRRAVGYVPDFFGVYDDLKVGEYLEFYAALTGIQGPAATSRRDSLLELVKLEDKRGEYVEALSRGMRQRLCLARALVHEPQVLLLDEPASGLDPLARVEMRDVLKNLAQMGKTIFISSHILPELSDLCSHVGIISEGALLREGTMAELLWAAERPAYVMQVASDPDRAEALLQGVAGVGAVAAGPDGIQFHCQDEAGAAAALTAVVAAGLQVTRFSRVESTLEATYLRLAQGKEAPS
jgi:ABC-2 type transport system ATP-binding protein